MRRRQINQMRTIAQDFDSYWIENQQTGCWEWQRAKTAAGYGNFRASDGIVLSHRFSYERTHGAIPDGMFVLHRCDNRSCVNPSHLFLGSHADNMRDMKDKGRANGGGLGGEFNGQSKLTYEKVAEIKTLWAAGQTSQHKLASKFGVSQKIIHNIVTGKAWAGTSRAETTRAGPCDSNFQN